jgi:hypothetical protein
MASSAWTPVPADASAWTPVPEDKPTSPAPDTRSLFQKAKDNFNANTQGAKPGDGFIKSAVENFGAGGGDLVRAIAHPIRTAGQILAQPDPGTLALGALGVGPNKDQAAAAANGPVPSIARMAGQIGTGAILGEAAGGVIGTAAKIAPRIPAALAEGKAAFTNATYPKNLSLTPEEVTAQRVVKSLQPDPAAVPNVKSASPEIPDALAYAKREGIPQNGKLDTAKALQGRADEIQAHYDDNILKPNKTAVQTVPANYDGVTVGENKATLGQINDRVDAINRELKSNFRKKLSSQTTEANASDADLISEKGKLTTILHDSLSDLTGIPAEDIANIRQRAGKLRSLAQEVTDSANKDTLAAGRREVSAGTFSLRNPIEGLQEKVGGGQEIIGNRAWKTTLDNIAPAEKPLPQPNPPGLNVATTPEAAQAEFLKAQELEQAAQDASAGRSSQASAARLANRQAGGSNLWSSQGYAKVVGHLQLDPSSGISRGNLVKFGLTPEGKSILVRASGLMPGGQAMRNIVQQIKAKLGSAK